METAERNYKDKLFIDYFSDRERLIEAYNALTGSDYSPDTKVEFQKIEGVMYRSQNNDIAFLIDDRLVVLIEHQSTINENMPLRLLMYLCEIYKRIVPQKQLYSEKLRKIPTPEFFVIYNGRKEYPDRMDLKLSDAFYLPKESLHLELQVTVFNINKGHNEELLKRSTALSDYSVFVALVNDYVQSSLSLDAAIDKAIQHCRECGIMGAYLENSSEVKKMLITEWNNDEYWEVMREEGREQGLEQGREEGAENRSLEIARKLKEEGVENGLISKTTGLSEEDISSL